MEVLVALSMVLLVGMLITGIKFDKQAKREELHTRLLEAYGKERRA